MGANIELGGIYSYKLSAASVKGLCERDLSPLKGLGFCRTRVPLSPTGVDSRLEDKSFLETGFSTS